MSERVPRKEQILKNPMAISERGSEESGYCLDIGYVLSYNEEMVKILRIPRLGGGEVSYGRSSVSVMQLQNFINRKNAKIIRPSHWRKQTAASEVVWIDGASSSTNQAEVP